MNKKFIELLREINTLKFKFEKNIDKIEKKEKIINKLKKKLLKIE